jgi:hypothetical protein
MLTGLLVIAFPVSVFSELWSHELRDIQEFQVAPVAPSADPDAVPSTGRNDNASERDRELERTKSAPQQSASTGSESVMQRVDVQEIYECLAGIQEREQRIRSILSKYKFEEAL